MCRENALLLVTGKTNPLISDLIIQGCLKNDRKCQRMLFEYCFPIMMKVCSRYTINEDEAQESMNASFLKILDKLHTLKNHQALPAWVKQVSVRTAVDFYRTKKVYNERNRFTVDNEYSTIEDTYFNEDFTESRLNSLEIIKLIKELPPTSREVLNLVAIDGFSHQEAAKMLNISEGASRWHLHRARQLMSEKLNEHNFSINLK